MVFLHQQGVFGFYLLGRSIVGVAIIHADRRRDAVLIALGPPAAATGAESADEAIAILEARRDKTRDLKQGMMQELLNGMTRLV